VSAEWVAAFAGLGTFLVIVATAIAAFVQLRHLRTSNQIVVLTEIRHTMQSADFQEALRYIYRDLPGQFGDPAARRALLGRDGPEFQLVRKVANFFDEAAALVKHDFVDRDLACDLWFTAVTRTWESMAPLTASLRSVLGFALWEDFEYLYVLCKRFRARFPEGTYPPKMERATLPAPWREATDES